MTVFVSPGATFKQVVAAWVSPGGSSWKRVLGRWIEVGGAWVAAFASGAPQLVPATIRSFSDEDFVGNSTLQLTNDGKVIGSYTDQTVNTTTNISDWYDPETAGVGAMFEARAVRVSGVSGALVTGSALDAWLPMTGGVSWTLLGGAAGFTYNRTYAITLEVSIRPVGGDEPVATALFTLSVLTRGAGAGYYAKGGGFDVMSPNRFNA